MPAWTLDIHTNAELAITQRVRRKVIWKRATNHLADHPNHKVPVLGDHLLIEGVRSPRGIPQGLEVLIKDSGDDPAPNKWDDGGTPLLVDLLLWGSSNLQIHLSHGGNS